ncbi:LapA family protein [Sagittula sp. SSi028]|uniref:LapA family protein n=1 Tax=Sagittula sp. SSi028 TaxID=3400636 RepID=UPI003AF4626A
MRYIRYAVYAVVAIVLIIVSLANRDMVTLSTLPDGMAAIPGMGWLAIAVELPLFIVVLGAILLGFVLGELFEWLREHKYRVEARTKQGEVRKLERELKKTQVERDKDKDEVLAILDQSRA